MADAAGRGRPVRHALTHTGHRSARPREDVAGAVAPADPNALAPALRLTPPGSTVTCVVTRTVYYPDAEAVAARAKAAIDAGTAGIAIWALGYETPETWARLQNLAP